MATTLHNTITKAKRFEANSQKAGTGLNSDGDLERVKAVPCFSSNQPGADMAEGRIILGQRNTLSYVIAKPFVTCTPFEAVNSDGEQRSEEHTSELQSLMRISYAVFCLKKKMLLLNTAINSTPVCNLHYFHHLSATQY